MTPPPKKKENKIRTNQVWEEQIMELNRHWIVEFRNTLMLVRKILYINWGSGSQKDIKRGSRLGTPDCNTLKLSQIYFVY